MRKITNSQDYVSCFSNEERSKMLAIWDAQCTTYFFSMPKGQWMEFSKGSRIALVSAEGIGDALMLLVVAYNLFRNDCEVVLYHGSIHELQDWFPFCSFKPYPQPVQWAEALQKFDSIITVDHSRLIPYVSELRSCLVLSKKYLDRRETMVKNFARVCRDQFNLLSVTESNGMIIPPRLSLKHYQYAQRVVLHPTSQDPRKNWPARKFIRLAEKLKREKFSPVFVVSPKERPPWENILNGRFECPLFVDLSHLAAFVYESGFMIGNDSGIGHLASSLGIPTLSIFRSKKKAQFWRPGWGMNYVITPRFCLPGFHDLWKANLSVRRVYNAFKKLFLSMAG